LDWNACVDSSRTKIDPCAHHTQHHMFTMTMTTPLPTDLFGAWCALDLALLLLFLARIC
jgi:hypothetical protein